MSYPTAPALKSFVEALGFEAPPAGRLAASLAIATKQWESACGWTPFLKDSADRAVRYNAPRMGSFGCVLELQGGLLGITSVTAGVEIDGSGGTLLVRNTDYWMLPEDGGTDEKPWTDIAFVYAPIGPISVVGRWGYATNCPVDAQEAILSLAAAKIMSFLQGGNGPIKRVKQGGVEEEYAVEAGRDTASQLQRVFDDLVAQRRAPWL